jgi:hypothetical protein
VVSKTPEGQICPICPSAGYEANGVFVSRRVPPATADRSTAVRTLLEKRSGSSALSLSPGATPSCAPSTAPRRPHDGATPQASVCSTAPRTTLMSLHIVERTKTRPSTPNQCSTLASWPTTATRDTSPNPRDARLDVPFATHSQPPMWTPPGHQPPPHTPSCTTIPARPTRSLAAHTSTSLTRQPTRRDDPRNSPAARTLQSSPSSTTDSSTV